MKIYLYDGSFDGLLTALYQALSQKDPEASIIEKSRFQPDLFSLPDHVATDDAVADRMYSGVVRRISRQTLRNLYHLYLSEIPEVGKLSLNYVRKGFAVGPDVNQRMTDPDIFPVLKKCRQVQREYHRMTGLIRFQSLKNNCLYADYQPDFNQTPLLAGHFSRRLAEQPWIIHDVGRKTAAFWDTKQWVLKPLSNPRQLQLSEEETFFQDLWRIYFRQIAIKERENLKRQQIFVPKKYRSYLTEFNE